MKPKIGLILLMAAAFLILVPILVPFASLGTFVLTMERTGSNSYVAYLSGGDVGEPYELQYRIGEPVHDSFKYGGVFITDASGKITTFELALPDPNNAYPYWFRWLNDDETLYSNTVEIDPQNLPSIGTVVGPSLPTDDEPESNFGGYFLWLGVGTAVLGLVVTVFETKNLKLPI